MYFKIEKGTPLFEQLMELNTKVDTVRARAQEVCDWIGAEGYAHDQYKMAGGIAAFVFKDNVIPEGFKKMGKQRENFCMPLATVKGNKELTKRNKEIYEKIRQLPTVETAEFNTLLNHPNFSVITDKDSLVVVSSPGICYHPEYVLIHTQEGLKYTPAEGMIEILTSEYEKLKKEAELQAA